MSEPSSVNLYHSNDNTNPYRPKPSYQAEIEDLNERVKELTSALEASHKSVRKLKSLARAVGRIRSVLLVPTVDQACVSNGMV